MNKKFHKVILNSIIVADKITMRTSVRRNEDAIKSYRWYPNKNFAYSLLCCCLLSIINTSFAYSKQKPLPDYLQLQQAVFPLSLVMMHDVVNPPAASRYYTYCLLGAYEIVAQNDTAIKPLHSFIRSYTSHAITSTATYDYHIAAYYCILETGKQMLPSGYMLEADQDKYVKLLKKNRINIKIIEASVAVAKKVAGDIISYAKADSYNKLSAKIRYSPIRDDSSWYPTPPAYIEAIEPHWNIVRTMVIDSSNQFIPPPLTPFSKDTTSKFYELVKEVYNTTKHNTQEQANMAMFWDCNPFAVATSGHMSIGFKKISPGGHWMNITSLVVRKANLDFDQAVQVHTIVAVALMDGFISCWDEKYRSNRIRPETYINRYIDVKWQPVLQTPPFPEYTSGHSVISIAAAEVLTYFLGDKFSYTDNSELMFEIPERNFTSFRQAAAEAAISRLYGGIHYRDAVVAGQVEGKQIGNYVVDKIKNAGIMPVSNKK